MNSNVPNKAHHGGIIAATKTGSVESSDPKIPEQKEPSKWKTIHDLQGAVVVNSKASIEGSALNKKISHSSAADAAAVGGEGRESAGMALR